MKTDFNSKLFEKRIDLSTCGIMGGFGSGCTEIEFTNGQKDSVTSYYNEEGELERTMECTYEE